MTDLPTRYTPEWFNHEINVQGVPHILDSGNLGHYISTHMMSRKDIISHIRRLDNLVNDYTEARDAMIRKLEEED